MRAARGLAARAAALPAPCASRCLRRQARGPGCRGMVVGFVVPWPCRRGSCPGAGAAALSGRALSAGMEAAGLGHARGWLDPAWPGAEHDRRQEASPEPFGKGEQGGETPSAPGNAARRVSGTQRSSGHRGGTESEPAAGSRAARAPAPRPLSCGSCPQFPNWEQAQEGTGEQSYEPWQSRAVGVRLRSPAQRGRWLGHCPHPLARLGLGPRGARVRAVGACFGVRAACQGGGCSTDASWC